MPGAPNTEAKSQTFSQPHALILGLGSNLGDSETVLRSAIRQLHDLFGPLRVAPLYRSAPMSPIEQNDFLNTVVAMEPPPESWTPERILETTQALEQEAGRTRGERWGPRILDIDLLLWGALRLDSDRLTIPHPRLRQRRFVLAPITALLPDLPLPPDDLPAQRVLRDLEAEVREGEQRIERISWRLPFEQPLIAAPSRSSIP